LTFRYTVGLDTPATSQTSSMVSSAFMVFLS
jgi:hypothetical protein